MKKFLLLIPAVLFIALIYQGCQQQTTEPENTFTSAQLTKELFNLRDSNGNDVGDVNVWNDADFLYVGFSVIDPYCLNSTEIKVALDDVGLTTATPFTHTLTACPTTDYYEIPLTDLGITTCSDIVVAASAELNDPTACTETTFEFGSGMSNLTTTVVQKRAGDQVGWTPVNEPAVKVKEPINYPYNLTTADNVVSTWDGALNFGSAGGTNVFGNAVHADWIWVTEEVENPYYGDVVIMDVTFDLCGLPNNTPIPYLYIATDNGFEVVSLNGTPLGYTNLVGTSGAWQTTDLLEANVKNTGWQTVKRYSLAGLLQQGSNTLRIAVANESYVDGPIPSNSNGSFAQTNPANNPGGLIFLITGNQTLGPATITASVKSGDGFINNYVPYHLPCPGDCQDETGYAGGTAGGGSAWWYYFDPNGGIQPVYAGQNLIDGASVTYSSSDGTLTIDLGDWELMYVNEPVKVTELSTIPNKRPIPGKAQYKTYEYNSDGDIVVHVNPASYYAIHLDLMLCP